MIQVPFAKVFFYHLKMSKLWLALLSFQPKATPSYLSFHTIYYMNGIFQPFRRSNLLPNMVNYIENTGCVELRSHRVVLGLQLQIDGGITASLLNAVHPFVFVFILNFFFGFFVVVLYFFFYCCRAEMAKHSADPFSMYRNSCLKKASRFSLFLYSCIMQQFQRNENKNKIYIEVERVDEKNKK